MKYNILSIDDRTLERTNATLVGRPDLMGDRTSPTVYEGMTGLSENVFINTKNRFHTITAEVTIPAGGANGVILAQAGRFGGWSLDLRDGKPNYTCNLLGLARFTVAAPAPVAPGKATIRYEFAYDGGGLARGGLGTISVNGQKVAEGRIERTQPMIFSADEGADVGEDAETPVVEDYGIPAPYKFTGQIARITVDVKEMKPADKAAEDKAAAEAQLQKAVRNWGRAGREVIGTRRPCEKGDRHGSRGHAGRDGSASDSPGAGDRSEVLRPQAAARRSRWFGDELAERYEDKVRVRLGLGYRPSSRTRLDAIYIRDWNRDSPEVYAVEDTQAIDLRWKLFF